MVGLALSYARLPPDRRWNRYIYDTPRMFRLKRTDRKQINRQFNRYTSVPEEEATATIEHLHISLESLKPANSQLLGLKAIRADKAAKKKNEKYIKDRSPSLPPSLHFTSSPGQLSISRNRHRQIQSNTQSNRFISTQFEQTTLP